MKRIVIAAAVVFLPLVFSGGEAVWGGDGASSDTVFLTVDQTQVSLVAAGRSVPTQSGTVSSNLGIEPSPWIVWRNGSRDYRGWIFTLNSQTGAQMGNRLEVTLPLGRIPADAIWSKHFLTGFARGIEPVPWIVFRDYRLLTYNIIFGLDGTPAESGPAREYILPIDPAVYGNATCMAEMPGTEFSDGMARLLVGSDHGYIAVLVYPPVGAEIIVDEIFAASTLPIDDLEPIPQYGQIVLGALINGVIKGIRFSPLGHAVAFTLADTRTGHPLDFDIFGAQDAPLPDPQGVVKLILANGSGELGLASISTMQSGQQNLKLNLDQREEGVSAVAPGSLLMLLTDGSAVLYDPAYSSDTGSSLCDANVTDTVSDVCGYICGDANHDGMVNVGDAVYVINYIFKGGPAPLPLAAGDANCDGARNVGDAVYVINYIFKGGPAPCCP